MHYATKHAAETAQTAADKASQFVKLVLTAKHLVEVDGGHESGLKTERESPRVSAEKQYKSGETGVFSTAVRILQRHLATTRPLYTVMDKTIGLPSERSS